MKIAIVTLGFLILFAAGLVVANAIDLIGAKPFLVDWAVGVGLAAAVLLAFFGYRNRSKKQAS